MEKTEGQRNIEDIRAAVVESPEFEELKDTSTRRHKLYQLIAENPDPLWREIGQQLRDGHINPAEVLSIPQYREQLRAEMADGLAHFAQMVDAIEDHLRPGTEGETSDGEVAGKNSVEHLSEVEDLSETLGPILRRR